MTTIKVTLPTENAGHLTVHTIKFSIEKFDSVIDAVSKVKNYNELISSNLWQVI